jgi:nitrate reductase gamma subunit
MVDNFFFVALPYISLVLFIGGSLYRAFTGAKTKFRGKWAWSARGDFLWTTRSTGFFGRASIGPAALSLHWGLVAVIGAHLVGFIGGAANWPGWVDFFRWTGMVGGGLVLYGALWALVRRIIVPQLRAMSTLEDYIVLGFLIIIAGLGLYHGVVQLAWGVSYAVGPWFARLFALQPDASLLAKAPLLVKLHMIVSLIFLAYVPFTKLVHMFSYPFAYLTRPYISMRRYEALKR